MAKKFKRVMARLAALEKRVAKLFSKKPAGKKAKPAKLAKARKTPAKKAAKAKPAAKKARKTGAKAKAQSKVRSKARVKAPAVAIPIPAAALSPVKL